MSASAGRSSQRTAAIRNTRLRAFAGFRDGAAALALADSLGRQTRKWDFGLSTLWRAAILANLSRRDEAMQFLGESRRHGQGMIAWHPHTALCLLHGYPPFDAMITPEK